MRFIIAGLFLLLSSGPAWSHSLCEDPLTSRPATEQRAYSTNQNNAEVKAGLSLPAQRLKIATWNVNLLNVRGWKSHFYQINSARFDGILGTYLYHDSPDILMLQEVWSESDREMVRSVAAILDYEVIEDGLARRRHGMQILVRRSAVTEVGSHGFYEFINRKYVFYEMIGSVRRGLLWVRLRLRDGQSVFFVATHFTAFSRYEEVRYRQVQELAQVLPELSSGADHVIVGGDLNFAADFRKRPEVPFQDDQLSNERGLYENFSEATGLRDLYRSVESSDPGYTYNPRFKMDVNSKYRGTDRRLDYLWGVELAQNSGIHVIDAGMSFREKIDGVYPSDHFLVHATVEFFQIPR